MERGAWVTCVVLGAWARHEAPGASCRRRGGAAKLDQACERAGEASVVIERHLVLLEVGTGVGIGVGGVWATHQRAVQDLCGGRKGRVSTRGLGRLSLLQALRPSKGPTPPPARAWGLAAGELKALSYVQGAGRSGHEAARWCACVGASLPYPTT